MTARPAVLGIGLIVALIIVGCGGHGTPSSRGPGGAQTASSTHPNAKGPSSEHLTPLTLGTADSVTLGTRVGPIAADERLVVFPEASGSHRNWNAVVSVSLASHHRLEVAHTKFSGGLINWAVPVESWIVYVDQSKRQSDSTPDVLWRVVAVEPSTGRHVTLSSNQQSPDPFVPVLKTQDGYVFWTEAEKDRSARELLWRVGWSKPHDVFRRAEMTPGSASLDGHYLVYLGPPSTGESAKTRGSDCWRVPLAGGAPEAMTHSGLAMGCFAAAGALLWTQHIDPATKYVPPDGVLDDPYELWVKQPDGAVHLLERGYIPLSYPAIGGGYAVWRTYAGSLVLQSIADPARRTPLPGKDVTDLQITDNAIVYVTTKHGVATARAIPLASIAH